MELLTLDEFQAQLEARGVEVSDETLRNWRTLRLLPASARGGTARHSASAVDQAVVIFELFKKRRSAKYVGWHLWMRGFDVDESFWAPEIRKSARLALRVGRNFGRRLARDRRDPAVGDRLDRKIGELANKAVFNQPLSSANRGMTIEGRISGLWTIIHAISGNYHLDTNTQNEGDRIANFQTMAGMKGVESDVVLGHRLDAKAALSDFLRACRDFPDFIVDETLFRGVRLERLKAARDDMWAALETGIDLLEATEFVFGPRAFGLRFVRFYSSSGPATMSGLLVLFAAIRDSESLFLSSAEILEMRDEARRARASSEELRRAISADPRLGEILTPKALKQALKSQGDWDKFIRKIEGEKQLPGMISRANREPENARSTDKS